MKSTAHYLNFPGTAEAAFELYRSVFGGSFGEVHRYADAPDGGKLPAADQAKILHMNMALPNGTLLMASDAMPAMGFVLKPGNSAYIYIEADDDAEVQRLFDGLSAGGTIEMAPQAMFWGAFYCSFADRFGTQWMISHERRPA